MQKEQQKATLQRARLGGRIRKLDCGRDPYVYGSKCALKELNARNVNNSNDVRQLNFLKIDGQLVTGSSQLLVKSMHKKVLKGT